MNRIKKRDILINVEFNHNYADRIGMLYLFYKLRAYAINHAGSIKGYNFTKSERYNVLNKLQKEGLVKDNRVVSYRKLCSKIGCKGIFVSMSFEELQCMDIFRGFILAAAESYVLNRNYKRQNKKAKKYSGPIGYTQMNWVKSGSNAWHKVKKISSGDNEGCLMGRVFGKQLSELVGISERSISRWRKSAPNVYRYNMYTPDNVPVPGRDREKFSRMKSGVLMTADLYIISKVDVFTSSAYDGNRFKCCKKSARRVNSTLINPIIPTINSLYFSDLELEELLRD